ncbi:MAG: hypothetical protein K9J12_01110 [Melioribacteraceae bacterium]|nr:hypothetical protein [Melioribacteraceae bacterium]MCF8263929.1 hypothetical protein [Melioribacteraceae bacterium]
MKRIFLLLIVALFSVNVFGQTYPEVSIHDIQFIPEADLSVSPYDYPSPYNGDTVVVTGVVTYQRFFGADPDSAETLPHWGAPSIMIQDTAGAEWGGMLIRFPGGETNAAFSIVDTGMIVKVTAEVLEYFTTTQLNIWEFDAQNVVGFTKRPTPHYIELSDLVDPVTGQPNYGGERWEHSLIEIRDVTATDEISLGAGSYGAFNTENTRQRVMIGNKGGIWRTAPIPRPGTSVDNIFGFIETRSGNEDYWHIVNPVYLEDVRYGNIIPPRVFNIQRDKGYVGVGDDVTITAQVDDLDGVVEEAFLYYSINGSNYEELDMFPSSDTTFSTTVPSAGDSAFVTYYIKAIDDSANVSLNPTDSTNRPYFYYVLDRPLTIQDVQKNPLGTGWSAYDGHEITVSGVVTADSAGLSRNEGPFVADGLYSKRNGCLEWN